MVRSILSVLAGYAAMAVLVVLATRLAVKLMLHGTDMQSAMKIKPTTSYLAVNLAYSVLFAVLGGFITATIAGRAPVAACARVGYAHAYHGDRLICTEHG
jgi:hypothetical protein